VLGGITVLTGLLWWTVAIHLLVSMAMVWLAVQLFVKIGEPDAGVPELLVPNPLRQLTVLSGIALSVVLVTGTMVTGAGPHAGDESITAPVPRLGLDIVTLVYRHAGLVSAYVSLVIGLGFALLAVRAPRPITLRLVALLVLIALQGMVGTVQFYTGVPAVLVAVHVLGAAACTAATAALWASMRQRSLPERPESQPVQG
jgi:cytochrome c oxidase assembly protein subunit 15